MHKQYRYRNLPKEKNEEHRSTFFLFISIQLNATIRICEKKIWIYNHFEENLILFSIIFLWNCITNSIIQLKIRFFNITSVQWQRAALRWNVQSFKLKEAFRTISEKKNEEWLSIFGLKCAYFASLLLQSHVYLCNIQKKKYNNLKSLLIMKYETRLAYLITLVSMSSTVSVWTSSVL